jgi:hypothetical protein
VILDGYVQQPSSSYELLSSDAIVSGRSGVARGMVVNENDRRRILADRFAKNFAWMDKRGVQQSSCNGYITLEAVLRIENRHVKFLDGQILQSLAEYLVNVARTANRNAVLAILGCHSSSQLESSVNRDGASVADSGKRCQSGYRLCGKSAQ